MPAAFASTNVAKYVTPSHDVYMPPSDPLFSICSAAMPQKPLVSHVNMQLDSFLANSVSPQSTSTAFTLL